MTREQAIRKRDKLAARLSSANGVLRGSLLERTTHHSSGCSKCARGEGHPLWVLTVGYPGGKTRQVSLRPDQVPQVRKAIEGYRDFKQALEFVNRVGALAEEEGHHPDILLAWGKAEITMWTHKIDGLTESDFIMAAKIDRILGA